MYPHTKFEIPTSKNIGDMDRTRKWDGHTDGQCDYYMPPKDKKQKRKRKKKRKNNNKKKTPNKQGVVLDCIPDLCTLTYFNYTCMP